MLREFQHSLRYSSGTQYFGWFFFGVIVRFCLSKLHFIVSVEMFVHNNLLGSCLMQSPCPRNEHRNSSMDLHSARTFFLLLSFFLLIINMYMQLIKCILCKHGMTSTTYIVTPISMRIIEVRPFWSFTIFAQCKVEQFSFALSPFCIACVSICNESYKLHKRIALWSQSHIRSPMNR